MDKSGLSNLSTVIECTLAQVEAVRSSQARFETVVRDLEEAWREGRAAQEESARQVREFTTDVERLRHDGTEAWQAFLRDVKSDLERHRDKQARRWAGFEVTVQEHLEGLNTRWAATWSQFVDEARAQVESQLDQQSGEVSAHAEAARAAWEETIERFTGDFADLQVMVKDDLGRLQGDVKKALAELRSEARAQAATVKKRQQEVATEVEKAQGAHDKLLKDLNGRIRALADQVKESDHVMAALDGRVQQVLRQKVVADTTAGVLSKRLDVLADEAAQNRRTTDDLAQQVHSLATAVSRLESRIGRLADETLPALQDEVHRQGSNPLARLLGGKRNAKPRGTNRGEND